MLLALCLLALLGLWWLGRTGRPLPFRADPRQLSGYAALVLAGLFALRGRVEIAALVAILGVWLLQERGRLGAVFARMFRPGARRGGGLRTRMIVLVQAPDGSLSDGRVLAGPLRGRLLSSLAVPELVALLVACGSADPQGAAILEAYLDSRRPGWREHAEGDADPGPRRPLQPGPMTEEEAYQILGLERGASLDEVRTAHRALMKRLHPDQGGSVEGAARVNAARDRLTNRHR